MHMIVSAVGHYVRCSNWFVNTDFNVCGNFFISLKFSAKK
jgi:hypothetical protein